MDLEELTICEYCIQYNAGERPSNLYKDNFCKNTQRSTLPYKSCGDWITNKKLFKKLLKRMLQDQGIIFPQELFDKIIEESANEKNYDKNYYEGTIDIISKIKKRGLK